jgi:preprotein translocase subunit SecA
MQNVIDRIGLEEDVPIEAGMISGSVRRAQEQVESQNFQIRKRILEYDDVLNKQREVIYAIRRDILMGGDVDTWSYVEEVLSEVVAEHASDAVYPEDWDLDTLFAELNRFYPVTENLLSDLNVEEVTSADVLRVVLKDARVRLEERKAQWEAINSEIERRGLVRADGLDTFGEFERRTLLSIVDQRWRENLYDMEYLREGIGWRGLSQRDPLVEYKREGFDMFQEMERGLKDDYVPYIYRRGMENVPVQEIDMDKLSTSGGEDPSQQTERGTRRVEKEPGRNDPCPCGALMPNGRQKKWKECGLKNTPEHQRLMGGSGPAAQTG